MVIVACGGASMDSDGTSVSGDTDSAFIDTGDDDPNDDTESNPTDTDDTDSDGAETDALYEAVDAACADLWFMSESDYPLDPLLVEGAFPVTATTIADAVEDVYTPRPDEPGLEERTVEVRDLDWFFDRYTEEQSWWGDAERAAADDWTDCRDALEALDDPKVFRLGEDDGFGTLSGAIDVFVVGGTPDDDLVGVWTISVET